MNAKILHGEPAGGKRIPLKELVPLKTPLLVQIFPIYLCNFKCKYCVFSTEKSKRDFISEKITMDIDMFMRCIDDLSKFPDKIKVLRFVGMGEPLLHKKLPAMIKYATESGKIEKIEILTNASLLTPQLSDKLIDSGLSKLLVSIQGTSAQKYLEISNVKIDFSSFLNNLQYFYEHRKNVKIHIKIIDCALENNEDEKKFYDIFGNFCDTIGVEYAGPIYPGVSFNSKLKQKLSERSQYGTEYFNPKICPQSFFSMQINPDGNVVPCYSIAYPIIVGNCNRESLYDIWNGELMNDFRIKMLNGISNVCETCRHCDIVKHRAFASDDLSTEINWLKKVYHG